MINQATTEKKVQVRLLGLRFDNTRMENIAHPKFPEGYQVNNLPKCGVEEYRRLYRAVGEDHMWWMRLVLTDRQLRKIIEDVQTRIYVLENDEGPLGFLELSLPRESHVNIEYFGLFPCARGQGLGKIWLEWAIAECYNLCAETIGLTTCSEDHPQAMRNYLAAGFQLLREEEETWNIPLSLGLTIPK
jgi:GNAT superfamily N-acetyltransferase